MAGHRAPHRLLELTDTGLAVALVADLGLRRDLPAGRKLTPGSVAGIRRGVSQPVNLDLWCILEGNFDQSK